MNQINLLLRNKYFLAFLLSLTFFTLGIFTLSDYGINWDAPYRMIRGQVLLSKLFPASGVDKNTSYSPIMIKPGQYASRFDLMDGEDGELTRLPGRPLPLKEFKESSAGNNRKLSFYNAGDLFKNYFLDVSIAGHPPFVDLLSALSNRLFYQALGILGDIESYQLIYLLFSSLGIFVVFLFVFDLTNSYIASLVGAICLMFFPYFFAEAHFNMKDPLQSAAFALSIWAFWRWVRDNQKKWAVLFIFFLTLNFLIKWNGLFLPFIIIPWLFLIRKTESFKSWFNIKALSLYTSILVLSIIFALLIFSPNSWGDPLGFLASTAGYYFGVGIRADPLQPAGFLIWGLNVYPFLLVLLQTPEIILILTTFGIWSLFKSFKKDTLKTGALLGLWLFVPVIRVSLPHFWFYNGLRQIMEILPAMAILSGLGANYLIAKFSKIQDANKLKIPNSKFQILLFLVISFLLLLPFFKYHPNENLYFNNLIGGLKGATQMGLVDTKISYGNVYKQAANWLNKNAEKDANIAHLDGPMFALSPLFLRDDLSISPFHFSGFSQKGEYILSLSSGGEEENSVFAQKYPGNVLKPVRKIQASGADILTIYKNSPDNFKMDSKVLESSDFKFKPVFTGAKPYFEIDLEKEVLVTGIKIVSKLPNCSLEFAPYIDEFIVFDSGANYGLQERNKLENGEIEFLFPAEKSRTIKIFPEYQLSCFNTGKITGVSYLQ